MKSPTNLIIMSYDGHVADEQCDLNFEITKTPYLLQAEQLRKLLTANFGEPQGTGSELIPAQEYTDEQFEQAIKLLSKQVALSYVV
jgi:hypothetical protein